MTQYGQFCPMAKAAEIVAERWTPLILRELMLGGCRFTDLQRGLPRISRGLLVQRLRSLEHDGLVERRADGGGAAGYGLTASGRELEPVLMELGKWGQRWLNAELRPIDLDTDLLMWDMRRRVNLDKLPPGRTVVEFAFTGAKRRRYWLILERPSPSVCWNHPGFESDLLVTADTLALHKVWAGLLSFGQALQRQSIQMDGPSRLAKAFPSWLALSPFAGIEPVGLRGGRR